MRAKEETRVYESNAQIKLGWLFVWKEMIRELVNSRELIWRLFLRDFLAKYKQSLLGVIWAIIMPLLMMGSFLLLNKAGVINIAKTEVPYPVFALLGLCIWQLFATGLTACTNSILGGGSMVVKINFPKEALVIASLAQSVFDFLVRIGLLAAAFVIYKTAPSWASLFLPFTLLPLILLTLALGLLFSLFNALMRDTANIVTLLTTFLLFLTPVLYPAPVNGFFANVFVLNPLSVLVCGNRDLVLFGYIKEPLQFWLVSFASLIIFLLSWRAFHLVESRMAERV